MTFLRLLAVLCTICVARVAGYPNGAPPEACGNLIPQHGSEPLGPSQLFRIIADSNTVRAESVVNIAIEGAGGAQLKGYMLKADNGGHFMPGPNAQLLHCDGIPGSAVTQSSADSVSAVVLKWVAPRSPGSYVIKGTIVQGYSTIFNNYSLTINVV